MKERVLVLGADGMVGRSWVDLLRAEGVAHDAWNRQQFELGNPDSLQRLSEQASWGLVVNCGAYTQVDKAESDRATADQINGTAVGELAACVQSQGARLIHYSTDYVFNGKATSPYPVDAPIEPVNAYGASKALGEQLLQQSGVRALLIRTSWVYAPWGKNFVLTMARLMREKPELRVIADQRGRPTSAQQLAARSWALAQVCDTGTFHLTDSGECTWHKFATAIRDELGLSTPIAAIPTSEYPTPAARPAYSVLDLSAADARIGPAVHWRSSLASVLTQAGLR